MNKLKLIPDCEILSEMEEIGMNKVNITIDISLLKVLLDAVKVIDPKGYFTGQACADIAKQVETQLKDKEKNNATAV